MGKISETIATAQQMHRDGYTYADIAQDLGIKESDVKPMIEGSNLFYQQLQEHSDDYMEMHGRNSEGYKDPTYIQAMRNLDGNGHHKSRRYKLMGVIFKACALADFELVGRITLRDKKTGEILR